MLCSILFCLLFELHFSFILHPSYIILLVHTFISCPLFSLTPLSIRVKKGESFCHFYMESFCHFYMALVHILKGKKFYFSCTFVGGEIFHREDAYTKREKTMC